MLSLVRPKASECEPQALLPIMPPTVQRVQVDGSGPKRRPCGFAAFCSWATTTPGSMRAVRASGSIEWMRLRCREVSTTMPRPIALPAIEVPAPRRWSGVPVSRESSATPRRSSALRGKTTTSGTMR